jgi:single-stranded DNA-binding protein
MSKKSNNESSTAEKSDSLKIVFADTNVSMKTGRLVKDPEPYQDGKFIRFTIAGNKKYQYADGTEKTFTNYFNAIVARTYTEAYEAAKELRKGDWVFMRGEDNSFSFKTSDGEKQNGNTIFIYQLALKGRPGEPVTDISDDPDLTVH